MSLLKNNLKISLFDDLNSFNFFFYKNRLEKLYSAIALLLLKNLATIFVRDLFDRVSILILINLILKKYTLNNK